MFIADFIASFQLKAETKPKAETIKVMEFSLKALVNLETSWFIIIFLFCRFQLTDLGYLTGFLEIGFFSGIKININSGPAGN